MSTAVMSVRVPEDLKERLDDLSQTTGRPSAFYVKQALEAYLEDLEDSYAADQAYKEWKADGFTSRDWTELKAEAGL
ncbi:MAG: DUF6290 family protein [Propionibacteriaceae bacterium]|jgi:RHH-type rel operon transcriptional repressor/antitoxin RelB|nr:DUF6290 family protein [Propionibacteriaceae bacterium]